MESGPTGQWLRDRATAGRSRVGSLARTLGRMLDARAWLRVSLGLLFVIVLPAAVAYARTDTAAAETAARLAVSFSLLVWLGRGLRLAWERSFGASRFAVWRTPVWDGLVGWLFALVSLLLFSLVWKRGFASVEPVGWLVPAGWLVLAAALSLPRSLRRAAAPSRRDFAQLGGFLAGFAWLAGPHLGVRRPYSSDPEQHLAWLTQLQLYGFVPDAYWQTDAPITYPMGFAALAHSLGALSGLAAPALIALLPPFVSLLVVVLVVVAARDLAVARELASSPGGRHFDSALFGLVVLAVASAFDSAQFSAWNVYEGTGRLAAGVLHVVPAIAGLALASGAVRLGAPARAGAGGGLLVFAAALTTALVALLNPSHLPLHAVLWVVVLAGGWLRAARAERSAGMRRVIVGAVVGALVAVALLAADGVTARRGLGIGEIDPALARVEAEFDAGFAGQTCWQAGCIAQAVLQPATLVGLATPIRVVVEGPVRALVQPAYDRFGAPWLRGPRSFPDLTGSALAPLHGLARWAAVPLPLLFAWLAWRRWRSGGLADRRAGWALALAGLLVAASLDAAVRAALRSWVDPDDAALRLLPDYANRASAVFFAQTFWPLLAAGLVFRARSRAIVGAVVLALVVVLVSAQSELGARRQRLERYRSGPGARDIADLRALESEHVPSGEHYLVSSHIAASNRERWLVPIDPSSPLYAQASRPVLFLYHLSSGARVAAADFEATCRSVRAAAPAALMTETRARWVALLAPDEGAARVAFGSRHFCAHRLDELFPDARLVGHRGRVALFRLW